MPCAAPVLGYFVLKIALVQSIFITKFCTSLGLFLCLREVKNAPYSPGPDPVLGYFVLKFASVQNMFWSSLFLKLNFALVLGYFLFFREVKMPRSARSCPCLGPGHHHPPLTKHTEYFEPTMLILFGKFCFKIIPLCCYKMFLQTPKICTSTSSLACESRGVISSLLERVTGESYPFLAKFSKFFVCSYFKIFLFVCFRAIKVRFHVCSRA